MKIATWNVNSVRARLPRVLAWLDQSQVDVACLQETKVIDDDFPVSEIQAAGYHCLVNGQKTYNGVAILTREQATEVRRDLPDDPPGAERRLIAATVGGVRIINVYVPMGSEIGSERYAYKLDWLGHLHSYLETSHDPHTDLVVCGDLNVAPEDRDVWDPETWRDRILFSEPEKQALLGLMGWGLADTLRLHHDEAGLFTWWDYRQGAFHRGWGLRLDHILATASLARRCTAVEIHRDERKGPKPSDHAPVVATFSAP